MKCFACPGPYHEATGHLFNLPDATRVAYCGPCARYFLRWMISHMKRRWGGADFYEAAATSIREGIYPSDRDTAA